MLKKFLKRIRFIFKFWKSIPFIIDFFLSKEVALFKKMFSALLVLAYVFFPLDLIPDFFAFFGLVDDLIIAGFIVERMVKWAPETLKEKYHLDRNTQNYEGDL